MNFTNLSPPPRPQTGPNDASSRWSRRSVAVATGIGLIAVVVAAGTGFVVGRGVQAGPTEVQSRDGNVEQWWTKHQTDVDALRSSIRDSQRALDREDLDALGEACLKMHDDAVITLRSTLPTPDRELTAELGGAIEDAHAAAHMCLAAKAGSINNYAGEFRSQLAASDRQLADAEDRGGIRPASA